MRKIFSNPNMINLQTKKGREAFLGAIQACWNNLKAVHNEVRKAGIREFTSKENFPESLLTLIDKYHVDITEIDTFYENAFDVLDLTQTKTSSFTVREVSSGLTFARVVDGMKAKVYSISGQQVTVPIDLYGAALEWLKTWFDDNEWWTIEDNVIEFRRKWYESKASIMYALIQAIANDSTHNTVYDTTAGASVVEKDVYTIDSAARSLITALNASGMGVTASTQMVMLVPIAQMMRVQRAFSGTILANNTGGIKPGYSITPYYTGGLTDAQFGGGTSTTNWTGQVTDNVVPLGYLAVPGRKNKLANRMDLTILGETDILAFAETAAGWGRYGAYLNEPQWRRVLGG
jgi:hypothetical protein